MTYDWFDLVVTTPQYRLPDGPNVLQLLLPPLSPPCPRPGRARALANGLRAAAATVDRRAGGRRPPYRFEVRDAVRLAQQADALAGRLGGALLVTTSPSTGPAQARALARPAHHNLWSPDADNAHLAILALADRFIVTGESVSMLAEACVSGKPVAIYQPRRRPSPGWSGDRGLGRRLARSGLASPPRDPQAVVRRLVAGGHAALLGAPEPARYVPVPDERARIVAAVAALLND